MEKDDESKQHLPVRKRGWARAGDKVSNSDTLLCEAFARHHEYADRLGNEPPSEELAKLAFVSTDQPYGERETVLGLNFDGVDLRFAEITAFIFSGCSFRGARFTCAEMFRVRFEGCDIAGADFGGAYLTNCDFRDTNYLEADFQEADFSCVTDGEGHLFEPFRYPLFRPALDKE